MFFKSSVNLRGDVNAQRLRWFKMDNSHIWYRNKVYQRNRRYKCALLFVDRYSNHFMPPVIHTNKMKQTLSTDFDFDSRQQEQHQELNSRSVFIIIEQYTPCDFPTAIHNSFDKRSLRSSKNIQYFRRFQPVSPTKVILK